MREGRYTEDQLLYASELAERYRLATLERKYYSDQAKQKRLDKGLKFNKITEDELQQLVDIWCENGMDNVTKALTQVYNTSSNMINKEYDWVKAMTKSVYYQEQLARVIHRCSHPMMVVVKNSSLFDKKKLLTKRTLSARIIELKTTYDIELKLMEKDEVISAKDKEILELRSRLEAELGWEALAENLVLSGEYKIKEIAERVGKSVPTINRLKKKLKEERRLVVL
jgi:hypothetical protein